MPFYQVKIPMEPPKARSETRSAKPSKDAVWISGFWDLQVDRNTAARGGWVWVPGRWAIPPEHGLHWSSAHWGYQAGWRWSGNDWWTWIPGHWTRQPAGGLDSLSSPT